MKNKEEKSKTEKTSSPKKSIKKSVKSEKASVERKASSSRKENISADILLVSEGAKKTLNRTSTKNPTPTKRNTKHTTSQESATPNAKARVSQKQESKTVETQQMESVVSKQSQNVKAQTQTVKKSDKQYTQNSFEVKAPENPLPPITITELPQNLQEACQRAGWTKLMPVQSHTLPYILAEQDMMIQSRTGSGKTGAYLIPTFVHIDSSKNESQALIIVPTRELAIQVEQEARSLFHDKDQDNTQKVPKNQVRIVSLYGGVGYGKQLDALQKGAHIVIGTPGRVLDHLLRRTLSLESLRVLIFDEADRMLSIGFYPDMKEIQKYLPKKTARTQKLLVNLFSATYPPRVLQLASEFLYKPQMLSLSQGQVHVATSQHYYCECSSMEKDRTLVRILEKENPASAIIFCNTKANVHYVTSVLQGFGYNADELSADLSQSKREHVLRRLRSGQVRFLVATDVAARGIDIPDLSHVFLYEPPEDRESYIHRAGRTGRAGAAGTVISLVDIMQKLEIERIAKFYKMEIIPMKAPANEEIALISSERTLTILEAKRRQATGLELERAKRFLPLVKNFMEHADDMEQLMILALIIDGEYQKSLFKKEILESTESKNESFRPHSKFSRNRGNSKNH